MCTIHIRSIFQLYVPVQAPANVKVATFQEEDKFGFNLQEVDQMHSRRFNFSVFNLEEMTVVSPACFSLAKRKIHYFQPSTTRNNAIDGIFFRLKFNHGFFDFRKSRTGGRINVRLDVSCFNHAGELIQNGSSPIFLILPKRRRARGEDDEDSSCISISWINSSEGITAVHHPNTDIWSFALDPKITDNEMQNFCSPDIPTQYNYHYSESVPSEVVGNSIESPDYNSPAFDASNAIQMFGALVPQTMDNQQYMVLYNGNAEVVGNFRALNFYKASDINIKEDIRKLIDDFDTRDALMRIDGVAYNFKRGVHTNVNKRFVGFIAQQVESVVPEAVQLIDGILHVDYEALLPYLNESIKKNYRDISNIKAENQRLQKSVDILYAEFVGREAIVKYQQNPSSMFSDKAMPNKHSNENLPRRRPVWQWVLLTVAVLTLFLGGSVTTFFVTNPDADPDLVPLHRGFNRTTDRQALVDLYMATGGASWTSTKGWLTTEDMCGWSGIECDSHARVSALKLSSFGLRGTIPESLGNLDHLDDLVFYNNSLHGTLPQSLFTMPLLRQLDVSSNPNLSGTIPSEANLTSLVRLWLNNCNLTGTIPKWTTLSKSLKVLLLHNNRLTGTIPPLPRLFLATYQSNQFEGSVPQFYGDLMSLDLANNRLTGSLKFLHLVSTVKHLNLANNSLSGEVALNKGQLNVIVSLDISNNNFTSARADVLLPHFLIECNASNNPFKCPIPLWLKTQCGASCT